MKGVLRSKAIQALLGAALSIGLILWMVLHLEWQAVREQLRTMQLWPLIPATLVMVAHYQLRALRWRYLLSQGPAFRLASLRDAIYIGTFATYVLPLRAGEFVRPFYLTRKEQVSFSSAFVSVVIERFFDLVMVLLTFGIALQFLSGLPALVYDGATSLTALAAGILLFIVLGGLFPDAILRLVRTVLHPLPKKVSGLFLSFAEELLGGAKVVHDWRRLAVVTFLTVLVWGSCFLQFYFYLWAFDVTPSAFMAITVAVIVSLAVAAPSAPGFIGVYEVGCIAAFALFGVSREIGAAYALVSHAHQFIYIVLYGPYLLWRSNLSLRELTRASSAQQVETPVIAAN